MDIIEEGVYFLYDGDELVYIGESDNVFRRIGQHIYQKSKKFNRFEIYPTSDRKRLESFLIDQLHPKYNIAHGKNYARKTDDLFPSLSIQECITKYEEYRGDPTIREIADQIGAEAKYLLTGLHHHNAPIYRLMGDSWRVDKKWYEANAKNIWSFVE